ncbi:MAG: tRNA 5-methoxyuridine(34)/uridine 5-oxyacetic acid(34) synthase CmoB, partial [Gammaproteobacteria bacterium]|nr:tRNA 5-methoxyuridine(34)/uridine 5-oxyacetic acid(34) synthase CmoB [Gammaproteobacteria bacterium]
MSPLNDHDSSSEFQKILKNAGQSRLNPLLPFVAGPFLDGIKQGDWARWRQRLARLPRHTPSRVQLADTISIGQPSDLTAAEQSALREQLKEFIPWRKGPFDLFGIDIDSEWRCEMKWSRLEHLIAPLEGRTV